MTERDNKPPSVEDLELVTGSRDPQIHWMANRIRGLKKEAAAHLRLTTFYALAVGADFMTSTLTYIDVLARSLQNPEILNGVNRLSELGGPLLGEIAFPAFIGFATYHAGRFFNTRGEANALTTSLALSQLLKPSSSPTNQL